MEHPKRLLLVEDEIIIALARKAELEEQGFAVETLPSGEAAVRRMESEPGIDLILMDVDLGSGGMDGTKAAKRILQSRSVPIVFLTSHAEREMVEKVKGITRYGYVLKDSGRFVLREAISMAFEIREQAQAREAALAQARRLNRVLRAVREIGRLIRTLPERSRLLGQAARSLAETSGYESAWIGMLASDKQPVASHFAGDSDLTAELECYLSRGKLPFCARDAIARGEGLVVHHDTTDCGDCPLRNRYPESVGLAAPIRSGEKTYGFLQVAASVDHPVDAEELQLVMEIAEDLGHAIGAMEAEKARKRMEERFTALRESGAFGFIIGNAATRTIEYANRTMEVFLGYGPGELEGKHISEIGTAEGNTRDSDCFFEAVKSGRGSYQIEKQYLTKDGDVVWGLLTAIIMPSSGDTPGETFGLVIDTTEKKSLGLRYQQLFDNAMDAIYLLSYEGDVVEVNEAACRELGRSKEEMLALSIGDIDVNFDRQAFQSFWSVPEGTAKTFKTTHRRKDGTLVPVEVNGTIFRLDGRLLLYGIARSLT